MTLIELMRSGPMYLDGGMGTLLQARGLQPGEAPERWGLLHPDEITAIHKAYFDAGSNMVLTNTFGCSPLRYDRGTLREMVSCAISCAISARERSASPQEKWIALDIGPTGKLLKPFGPLSFEEAVTAFAETVRIGVSTGVDCIFIETMNDSYETKAALLAAKENANCPVMVSNAYGSDGKLMTGAPPEAMVAMLEGLGADAIGVNCSLGPDSLTEVVRRYLRAASIPVLMKPNAGLPYEENGMTRYPMEPEQFAGLMAPLVDEGLRILGGCCGTTPSYIAALRERIGGRKPPDISAKTDTMVSSRSRCVYIGQGKPKLIGERINPTGKKRFKQALMEHDIPFILGEGIAQEERGVDLLDVNVGIPDVDETAMLPDVVEELQAISDLPLQLDTSDPIAMERALRIYNGKAMINSVNGCAASMETVFPLAKKYGGVLVALTLDEKGIPATAEGRLAIALKILERAASYGIPRKDIVFDPLTMAVSTDSHAAQTTLDAVRLISRETGCGTVLGVSNISFGLPAREIIGQSFFLMALEAGLSAAIMNPKSDAMLGAYRCILTLTGQDAQCSDYVAFASALPAVQTSPSPAVKQAGNGSESKGLRYAVTKGLHGEAARLAASALEQDRDPMSLVNEEIIPALDDVGKGFEEKTIFLPQLMMSAEAAGAAFEVIKRRAHADAAKARCRIVLATVRGDVHDIGKNIVRLILENYGYQVTDLGRDVAPEEIVRTVQELHAPICGLSALMTTTVPAMEETVRRLHQEAPWCRIMVGGAVLTESYAERIHADAYAKDAMAAVRCAEHFEQDMQDV